MLKRHVQRNYGFTLVELLIVIGITAILAALAFAVFSRVGEGGRRNTCASNLRQLGLAILQYSQDHNGGLPPGKNDPYTTPARHYGQGWAGSLFAYHKASSILKCPSDIGFNNVQGTASYGYNQNLVFEGNLKPPPRRITRLRAPSKTVLLFEVSTGNIFDPADPNEDKSSAGCGIDGTSGMSNAQYATGHLGGINLSTSISFSSDKGRHDGVSIYLFGDGHVKALLGAQVSPGFSASSPRDSQLFLGPITNAAGTQNLQYAATFSPY